MKTPWFQRLTSQRENLQTHMWGLISTAYFCHATEKSYFSVNAHQSFVSVCKTKLKNFVLHLCVKHMCFCGCALTSECLITTPLQPQRESTASRGADLITVTELCLPPHVVSYLQDSFCVSGRKHWCALGKYTVCSLRQHRLSSLTHLSKGKIPGWVIVQFNHVQVGPGNQNKDKTISEVSFCEHRSSDDSC